MIDVDRIRVSAGHQILLDDVSFTVETGQVLAIVGPNGAGKTTLLRLISGDQTPDSGSVLMAGRSILDGTLKERARRRALVKEEPSLSAPFSVFDVVLTGRTPHIFGEETDDDWGITREALHTVGMSRFADAPYVVLCGAEKQQVHLARALAQIWDANPRFLLLDEPVAHLDIAHQHEVLGLVQRITHQPPNTTTIVVLQDLNLAMQYADRVLLMKRGGIVAHGPPAEVLTPDNIRKTYGMNALVMPHPQLSMPLIIPIADRASTHKDERTSYVRPHCS